MKKSIAVNTVFNVIYKLLNIIFPLITAVYLSRVLGPEGIGKVTYAQTIMSYFLVVASLGIPTYGMREVAKCLSMEERNIVFSELFLLNFITSCLCSGFYTFMIFFHNSFNGEIKLYLCVGLTLYLNTMNVDWFYSGCEEYVYITTRSTIIKIISIIAIFFFVRTQDDYILYALITSFATTGNYIFNIINLRKRVTICLQGLNLARHFKPVLVLLVTLMATDLYNQIDITMLGAMRTDSEVGYYSNAVKVIRIISSITTAISATILPRLCLYYKASQKKAFDELFNITMKIVMLIAIPCTIGLTITAESVVTLMFGKQFIASSTVIAILSPIILIITVSYLFGSVVLTATSKEKYLLLATCTGAIVNFAMNAILIPDLGTRGAALASVIGELVVLTIHFYYGKKHLKVLIDKKYMLSLMCATVAMSIVALECSILILNKVWGLVVCILSATITYVSVLLILRNPIMEYLIERVRKHSRYCN